ncbi:MAG: cation:proton antiporter [Clostridia bacterium]|nr:cation:proton antiporter [Clostridia bacterium]
MLLSIALILILGLLMGSLCKKLKLPGLLGMLLVGIVTGPFVLNIIDVSILNISDDIRKIALVIILTRAGLSLDIEGLKKIGRPAFMMCFVPASFELLGMLILGTRVLNLSLLEACILGAVLAAVSPAVVVPRMVKLMDEKFGTKEGIPQLILAGASVDDVYVIVLFTTFVNMMKGEGISVLSFVNIPVSIIAGIAIGFLGGILLSLLFNRFELDATVKVITTLCLSFVLVAIENSLTTPLTFSALIAIMFIGVALQKRSPKAVAELTDKYKKLWIPSEVFLFVLVGAKVDISYLKNVGVAAIIVILGALIFRMIGVFVCLLGTRLNSRERLFTMLAYTPKATVQAAIGGIPLSLGMACGDVVLTVAVLAIVLTAPLGAFAIDSTYKRFLKKA